jgi:tripeptide aminopeptidase
MLKCLEEEVDAATIVLDGKPVHAALALEINDDYPAMQVPPDAPILKLFKEAGAALRRPLEIAAAGGGSDANIFNQNGIETVILGSGMENVHSVNEEVSVEDMVKVTELLVEMIRRA